jgi:hypothetical protein
MTQAEIVTDTDIEKVPTEVLPSTELSGVLTSLNELKTESNKLDVLKEKAVALGDILQTKESSIEAGKILSEVRGMKKTGEFKINPFLATVDKVAKFLRGRRTDYENKCKEIDDLLNPKIVDWDRREKAAAAAEQNRINAQRTRDAQILAEQNRLAAEKQATEDAKKQTKQIEQKVKAGEIGKREAAKMIQNVQASVVEQKEQIKEQSAAIAQDFKQVKVKADVATFDGQHKTRRWNFTITDINKIPRELLYPKPEDDGSYDPDKFPAIKKLVNETKDGTKAEAACPGISVSYQDKV